MVFVFATVIFFFSMLFWQAEKLNRVNRLAEEHQH